MFFWPTLLIVFLVFLARLYARSYGWPAVLLWATALLCLPPILWTATFHDTRHLAVVFLCLSLIALAVGTLLMRDPTLPPRSPRGSGASRTARQRKPWCGSVQPTFRRHLPHQP